MNSPKPRKSGFRILMNSPKPHKFWFSIIKEFALTISRCKIHVFFYNYHQKSPNFLRSRLRRSRTIDVSYLSGDGTKKQVLVSPYKWRCLAFRCICWFKNTLHVSRCYIPRVHSRAFVHELLISVSPQFVTYTT